MSDYQQCPGTGTPEAGGWTSREVIRILRGLEALNVVGADIVEVAPPYDGTGTYISEQIPPIWQQIGVVVFRSRKAPLLAQNGLVTWVKRRVSAVKESFCSFKWSRFLGVLPKKSNANSDICTGEQTALVAAQVGFEILTSWVGRGMGEIEKAKGRNDESRASENGKEEL